MKRFFQVLMIVLTLFCLTAGQCVTATESFSASGSWDVENSISLETRGWNGEEILEKGADAFHFQLSEVIVSKKYVSEYGISLNLLLIFDDSEQRDSALPLLKEDERFENVKSNEEINTLHLEADSTTIKVGETLTVSAEGVLKLAPSTSGRFDTIEVMLADYDSQKEYTVADFPQCAFSSLRKVPLSEDAGAYFYLKLENPGYYNYYRAINTMALDPAIVMVGPEPVYTPDWVLFPKWEISDTSIAEFITSDRDEGGKMSHEKAIKGLKPGKVTVTYVPSFGHYLGYNYAVTCEITVIDADTASETAETNNETNEITGTGVPETTDITGQATETGAPGSGNPQTGDRELSVLVLGGTASLVGMAVVAICRKKKDCAE